MKAVAFFVFMVAVSVIAASPQVYGATFNSFKMTSNPVVKNVYGDELDALKAGQQVVIEYALENRELQPFDAPVIAITEVRDDTGYMLYFAFRSLDPAPGEITTIGSSWLTPNYAQADDLYHFRFYVLSSLAPDAKSLNFVVTEEIKVK